MSVDVFYCVLVSYVIQHLAIWTAGNSKCVFRSPKTHWGSPTSLPKPDPVLTKVLYKLSSYENVGRFNKYKVDSPVIINYCEYMSNEMF